MTRIAADPVKAMVDYGHQSQSCGKCGASLSNGLEEDDPKGPDGLTSIERGIGPVCAGKMGMW